MYSATINLYPYQDDNTSQFLENINLLPEILRMNGQVCGREFPLAETSEGYVFFVMIPDIDSLDDRFHNRYVKECIDKLNDVSARRISFTIVGKDPTSADTCLCDSPTSYILYTNFILLEPPLRCGDCFRPVPLYRIPPTSGEEYNDVITWQSDYQSCHMLYMNSGVAVRCAKRELSHEDSSLSKFGISICKLIHNLTGKSTYYYLFPSRRTRTHNCPICAQDWYIDQPWHDRFHFKCDNCLILSDTA